MFKFVIRAKCEKAFSSGFIHRCVNRDRDRVFGISLCPACMENLILTHHFDTVIQFEKSHLICRSRGHAVPALHDALINIGRRAGILATG